MKDEIKEILEILKKCYNLKDENFDNYISLYQLGVLLDYITTLQEELKSANESISWWQNRFNAVEKQNNSLKELCNKYEEEHSSTFKEWQKAIKENDRLKEDK